jgi:hypothetical protein
VVVARAVATWVVAAGNVGAGCALASAVALGAAVALAVSAGSERADVVTSAAGTAFGASARVLMTPAATPIAKVASPAPTAAFLIMQ